MEALCEGTWKMYEEMHYLTLLPDVNSVIIIPDNMTKVRLYKDGGERLMVFTVRRTQTLLHYSS